MSIDGVGNTDRSSCRFRDALHPIMDTQLKETVKHEVEI